MKLTKLSYHDLNKGWGFDNLTFHSDITLLVGASGVGKTRILSSIRNISRTARDEKVSLWGVKWSLEFLDDQGIEYTWNAEFQPRNSTDNSKQDKRIEWLDEKKPQIVHESLSCGSTNLFVRDGNRITLHGKEIEAKLSPYESGMILLSEEDEIKPAKSSVSRILLVDSQEDQNASDRYFLTGKKQLQQRFANLESIQNAELATFIKLALVYENSKDTFDQIAGAFRSVFPLITDIEAKCVSDNSYDYYELAITESGVDYPFSHHELSSGMYRTLIHFARIALWPRGTVILVDEFENSLGVNCIDAVAKGLLGVGDRLQFVITSHHPYIINSIPPNRWKVVGRTGGQLQFFSPEQLNIGRSKHAAFTQLINTDVFQYGRSPV